MGVIFPTLSLSGNSPDIIHSFMPLVIMGQISCAELFIILIGMSLALLFSRPLIMFITSFSVQSCMYILDGLARAERNAVKGVTTLIGRPLSSLYANLFILEANRGLRRAAESSNYSQKLKMIRTELMPKYGGVI